MKLWRLPQGVANTLIVSGTALAIGSAWVAVPGEPRDGRTPAALGFERFFTLTLGFGLAAGMIVNGIARSTRPPEEQP
jgi:hypothetical protein